MTHIFIALKISHLVQMHAHRLVYYSKSKEFVMNNFPKIYVLLLSLAPQLSLSLGFLHKIQLNFLEASQQFSFLQGKVVSPTPNPHPRGLGLYIYIPQRQGGYPF
jgi:hypothetical protein